MGEIHGYIQVGIGSILIPFSLFLYEYIKSKWKFNLSVHDMKTFIEGLCYTRKPTTKNGTVTYAFDDINLTEKIMTFLKNKKIEKSKDGNMPVKFDLQDQGANWVGTIVGFKDNYMTIKYLPKGKFDLMQYCFGIGKCRR